MKIRTVHLLFLLLLFIVVEARAQHEAFIYGEIKLKNKQLYTGQIRWSGGQVLWSDILLVAKQVNPNLRYLNEYQLDHLAKEKEPALDWKFMNLWKDKYPERKSEILCRFGDISFIHVTGALEAQLFYTSGSKVRLTVDPKEGRHLGRDISVYQNDQWNNIKWSDISTIRFFSGPALLEQIKGQPLYGTVMTTKGPFSGLIQWNKLKYLDSQELEGKTSSGQTARYSLAGIAGIDRDARGSLIRLKSGRKVLLSGGEEVTAGNQGIVVMHPVWGRVIVSWKAFRSIQFEPLPDQLGYAAFSKPKKIYGIVSTKDKKIFKGNCVFDMDEEWNCELLEGNAADISYQLPFKYISKVVPVNENYARVSLKNGSQFVLGNHNDVSKKNWGILVWQSNSGNQYIPWNMVSEISFR